MSMSSEVVGTRCIECQRAYQPTPVEPHRCVCGGPLDLEGYPTQIPDVHSAVSTLWDYADALPPGPIVDLGAGGTPTIEFEPIGATLKLEQCNPTGSFKDRGAAILASRAKALGVERLVDDSSGNAGRAIAAHAARAGIAATIYVPATVDRFTVEAIQATGSDVQPIDGDRTAVTRACLKADDGWYASHAWRPSFFAGTATFAWELIAEFGERPPEVLVCPVGHGTLLCGAFLGFRQLKQAGVIETIPRLVAAQPAWGGSLLAIEDTQPPADMAPGVRIDEPARAAQVREAIDATDGEVLAIDREAIETAHTQLLRAGIDACSTAALAPAGVTALRQANAIDEETVVVAPITGRARHR